MTKPNKKWNIWRIKSPWLRLPVAWAIAAVSLVVCAACIIACAIIGAVMGAWESVAAFNREVPYRDLWKSCITWRAA